MPDYKKIIFLTLVSSFIFLGFEHLMDSQFFNISKEYALGGSNLTPNLAISENGLLPYQLCGSTESNLGAGIAFSTFVHEGIEQLIAVTASSSWGEGAKLPRVEFLAYFKTRDNHCPHHCEILPRNVPVINPTVFCHVLNTDQHRPGFFSIPAAESLKKFIGGMFHVVNIMCPSLELDLLSSGQTKVELYIGDEGSTTFSLNLCYIHVASVRKASLCTEPLVGINNNDSNSLAFWRGITNVWPNGYHGHTLLDAFLKYHMNVLGLHVTLNAYLPEEFTPHVQKYLGPNFAYRSGWNLPGLGASNKYFNYEVVAEATCQWEHRLDSKWVMAISAPDNFVFPRIKGKSFDDVIDRLDPNEYSGVEIPMMLSHSRNMSDEEGGNVLRRWRLLDENDEPFHLERTVPLFNPRHSTHTCVHWNHARTDEFNGNLVGMDVIVKLTLSIVHIMAITRPTLNRVSAIERGDLQPWFDELGNRLEVELETNI